MGLRAACNPTVGCEYTINFDPADEVINETLSELGIAPDLIANGRITENDCTRLGYSFDVLASLALWHENVQAQINNNYDTLVGAEYNAVLTRSEAEDYLQISAEYRENFKLLSSPQGCLANQSPIKLMANNILGIDTPQSSQLLRTSCPIDRFADYDIDILKGVGMVDENFTSATSLNEFEQRVHSVGQHVVKISIGENQGQGSGVVFSEFGDILTARHVLYDDQTEQLQPSSIVVNGEKFEITVDMILGQDKEQDIVWLRVPALEGRFPDLNLSQNTPAVGDQIWLVGFPLDDTPIFRQSTDTVRVYSTGRIYGYDQANRTITTTAESRSGASGGVMINENGDVIGIIHANETTSDWDGIEKTYHFTHIKPLE